ncbi:class I SAM-dependent rRNA methyltransferase [archaeon]|nr:MAG: class I SAM-dependent rRNA methyltransferase [archaeon]
MHSISHKNVYCNLLDRCSRTSTSRRIRGSVSSVCGNQNMPLTLLHIIRFVSMMLVYFRTSTSPYKLGRGCVGALRLFATTYRRDTGSKRRTTPKSYTAKKVDIHKTYENTAGAPKILNSNIPEPYAVLVPGKSHLFKIGNPTLYSGVINELQGNPKPGDLISVADHNYNVFAKGFYNPHSLYQVRLLTWKHQVTFNSTLPDILRHHIKSAIHKRTVLNLPSSQTNSYRLVNGEGDQLSGLVVDILGENVVVQSSAIWIEQYADTIVDILCDLLMVDRSRIVWKQSRARLEKDGIDKLEQKEIGNMGKLVDKIATSIRDTDILENGLRYLLTSETEQKTGFYCDQRENRLMLRALCQDKTVLDTYCYTGGFTLNALLGGASHVTAVDSSKAAIKSARKNVAENMLDTSRVSFMEGNALQAMLDLHTEGKTFDIVICDPPRLAPKRKDLAQAGLKYQSINKAAMKLVNKEQGGLLLTCTCSAPMTNDQGMFLMILQEAAKAAQREITLLSVSGAAADHALSPVYQEGRYLTAVLLFVR